MSDLPELGTFVLRLELPLELAPTLNTFARMHAGRRAKLQHRIDDAVLGAVAKAGGAKVRAGFTSKASLVKRGKGGLGVLERREGGKARIAIVTRHSSGEPDEIAVDVCGGKVGLDRLVAAGVLRDDSPEWCLRVARWEKAPPSKGKLVIEIFEIAP